MTLYIKFFLCIILIALCNTSMSKENTSLSLLDIYKYRSAKIAKSRIFYGKKILQERFKSNFLVNGAADMANRLGCDPSMQTAAKRGLGKRLAKNSRVVTSACEVKSREK